jgi:hypothetical protein
VSLFWIISLVLLLYVRTLKYHYVEDDYVERDGYLYDIPMERPAQAFWDKRPSSWYRLFMIGMHCVNVSIIYMLWGWAPALLFAVHPQAVHGVAWVTGNYYATTAYFCLISYYILHTFPGIWGTAIALSIYTAALNSTICAVGFPFFLLAVGNLSGLAMLVPLVIFFKGKRFTTGMKIRTAFQQHCIVDSRITPRRFFLVTKLVARYIYTVFVPNRLGIFSGYGQRLHDHPDEYNKLQSADGEFWSSLLLCVTILVVGLIINPVATLWFFVFMGVHSQLKLMGQFYAQRYLYLPMIGLCVLAGTVLQHYPLALTAVVTFFVIRTSLFIPAWRNQEALIRHDVEEFPDNPNSFNNAVNFLIGKHNGVFKTDLEMYETGSWVARALRMNPENHEIHMNACAFYNAIGQIRQAQFHTEKALEYLKRLGEAHPLLPKLQDQLKRIKDKINEQDGRLGGSLSHRQEKERRDNGTSKEEGWEGSQHNRDSEHQGRTARVAECVG